MVVSDATEDPNHLKWISNNGVGRLNYGYDDNGNKTSESWTDVASAPAMTDWNFSINNYDAEDRFLDFHRVGGVGFNGSTNVSLTRQATDTSTVGNVLSIVSGTDDAGLELTGTRTYATHANTGGSTYELQDTGDTRSVAQVYNDEGAVVSTQTGIGLAWNAAGQLHSAQVTDQSSTGIQGQYEYGYDCNGRRIWRRKNGQNTRTVFLYGGPNVITEFETNDNTAQITNVKRYAHGTTIDELLLYQAASGTEYGVTRNQQWSVMALYDLASGEIARRFNYGVFGTRYITNASGTLDLSNSPDDLGFAYGYTSRRHDDETGLMYFRARCYDPATGEFVSQDPLEYVDGMSLYRGYFAIIGIDPDGRDWTDIPIIGPLLNYGNYCGPTRAATCPIGSGPEPIDALDAACEKHDCCLPSNKIDELSCRINVCNQNLCNAADTVNCYDEHPFDPVQRQECYQYTTQLLLTCKLLQYDYDESLQDSDAPGRPFYGFTSYPDTDGDGEPDIIENGCCPYNSSIGAGHPGCKPPKRPRPVTPKGPELLCHAMCLSQHKPNSQGYRDCYAKCVRDLGDCPFENVAGVPIR